MKLSRCRDVVLCAVAVLAVVQLLQQLPASDAAVQCSDVLSDLINCVGYLTGNGAGGPPAGCCTGVSKLASSVTSTADRRAACACIKSTVKGINVNPKAATALPGGCGITLPFTPSANIDCSKLN